MAIELSRFEKKRRRLFRAIGQRTEIYLAADKHSLFIVIIKPVDLPDVTHGARERYILGSYI